MKPASAWASVLLVLQFCGPTHAQDRLAKTPQPAPEAAPLLGQPLFSVAPPDELAAKFEQFKNDYLSEPEDPDKLIWYGRFCAYTGDYRSAIDIFSKGVDQFPEDARMLRHRAHRFITIRQFDKAIADMDRAVALIQGQPNKIEPDGMPNPQNIPVSSLHGNIWYHKGLAHYLNNDLQNALTAFTNCVELRSNDDNTVSATHWIYMILRRMGRDDEAQSALAAIHKDMNIIENFGYHKACLFYKGELPLGDITGQSQQDPPTPANDSLSYALGNWYYYNGDMERARESFQQIVDGGTWTSFGHIAAEADLARLANQK